MIILHPKSGKVAFQPKELVGKGLKLWWQHFAQKKYVKHKSVIFFGVRQRDKEEEDFSSCHLRLVLRICYCSLHLYCISTICTGTVANGKYSGDEWYRNYRYVDQGQVANCTRKTYWSFIPITHFLLHYIFEHKTDSLCDKQINRSSFTSCRIPPTLSTTRLFNCRDLLLHKNINLTNIKLERWEILFPEERTLW